MTSGRISLPDIEWALHSIRVPATPGEYDLHRLVSLALCRAQIPFTHEAPIAPRCRIDFLVGDVGIEVKKGRVASGKLYAQAGRYLQSDKLSALVLVTAAGANLPGEIAGKPVIVFGLNRLWGVALP